MQGKVLGVPVVYYRKTGTHSSSRGRARAPAPSREPSAGPFSLAPPIPNAEEEEEAATEAPREPPAADDNDDDLYAQPQACLACRLALDGAAELPADVCALLAQGLRSIYNDDDEYIELPEAMERACRAAIDAKAVVSDAEPKSYRDAMRRLDSELWYQAMVREMEAHLENGTWELVKLPPGRKAIGSKWVFKVKRNPDDTVEQYKARLVAKGFGQRPGIDFDETFAQRVRAWGVGADPAGTGNGRLGCTGQGAMRVAGLGADGSPGAAAWGGVCGGAGAGAGAGCGGVPGSEGAGLAVLDDHELLKLESESDGCTAGSNRGGIATPSESVESETSSSSGECSASPGSAGRPKRAWMVSRATRDVPGNSSLFHTMSRETLTPPHPPLADGSHSFQPLKSSGQPRKTHGLAWSCRLLRSLR
jgi:hypothetical protein